MAPGTKAKAARHWALTEGGETEGHNSVAALKGEEPSQKSTWRTQDGEWRRKMSVSAAETHSGREQMTKSTHTQTHTQWNKASVDRSRNLGENGSSVLDP